MKFHLSHRLVISVFLWTLTTQQIAALTQQQLAQKVDQLKLAMTDPADNNGRLTAGAVRLAFHDCVGGCDGCINLRNSDNAGLQVPIEALEAIFQASGINNSPPAQQLMSRADFWALSGIVGAQVAADRRCPGGVGPCSIPRPSLVFRSGRVDCSTSPTTNVSHQFPSGHAATDATLNFFAREFGFNERQSVAIMGAHTLGRTNRQHSGFNGPWVEREDVLDNDYYQEVNRNWNQRDISDDGSEARFQWFRGGRNNDNIMLNVDMCLLKELRVDALGASGCPRSNDCADSRTAGVVREYSRDNGVWMRDFSEAFQRMIEHGASDLVVPGDASVDSATTAGATRGPTTPAGDRTSTDNRATTQSVNEDRRNGRGDGGRGDGDNRRNRNRDGRGNNNRDGRGNNNRDGRGGRNGNDRRGRRGRSLIDFLFQ